MTVGQHAAAQIPAPSAAISPDAWLVYPIPNRSAVQVSKTASDGATLFAGGCDKAVGAGFIGTLSGYSGADLQRANGQVERVLFEVTGEDWKEVFSVKLRYNARNRSWEIANAPLAPVFVNSFSRGSRLIVRNGQWREVVSFDLSGSSAAARTMRATCGFS